MTAERATPWRYAICNELFEDWALAETAAFAAEAGYTGLELAPFTLCQQVTDLDQTDRRRIRRTIEGAGLAVAGLHWLLARTEGLQLNDPDPAVRERTTAYLLALIEFCADVGGEILVFGSPAQRNPRPGWPAERAWESTAAILHRCGERAAERGVIFCIEALGPPGSTFLTSVDEAAEMVRRVDHPHLRMMVDVKAMAEDPRPVSAQIQAVAPLIHHVHANDPNQLGPGMGAVDFRPILHTLADLNYEGWISVEVFDYSLGPETIAHQSLTNLRQAEPGREKPG